MTALAQEHPLWMRFPAISPDGQTIAFSYKGDLFTVPATGGAAKQLTTHPAYDAYPIWSPDGKQIAFASDREGSLDVYIMNCQGGVPTRLTTHSANETPTAFLDNGHILYNSALMPTAAMDLLGRFVHSTVLLNLAEGIFRIILFILYILLISKMEDIHRVFMYHGAEHKSIHTFENGLDLIPENARGFYTLHPRCGTSFLMFVMVISLVLFSLLGWPSLVERILSRLLLIPVVAALSYEVLRWAGRSDGALVKLLSLPGLYLQKLTTAEPTDDMVEVAMTSLKAVLVPAEEPCVEGICDADARIIEEVKIDRTSERAMDA